MMRAYVGLASAQGLRAFHVERTESLRFVRRSALRLGNRPCVGFWAVVSEAEAQVVRILLQEGESETALRHLDSSARELGSVLPQNY